MADKKKREFKIMVKFKNYEVGQPNIQEDDIQNSNILCKYGYLEEIKPKVKRKIETK